MPIVPLNPVVLTGRTLQYLHDFTVSPCGADLGRLNDDVIPVFASIDLHLPSANLRLPVEVV